MPAFMSVNRSERVPTSAGGRLPADLLRAADFASDELRKRGAAWPKTPRALAGRLRRAQMFLRTLGIEVTFSRKGRGGTRMIRMSRSSEHTVSTVSSPRHQASDEIGDTNYRSDLVDPCSIGQGWLAAAAMLTVLTQTPPFLSCSPNVG